MENIKVNINSNNKGIIIKMIFPENLFMAHVLVSPVNYKTYISLVNISEKDVCIKLPIFNIIFFTEPLESNE